MKKRWFTRILALCFLAVMMCLSVWAGENTQEVTLTVNGSSGNTTVLENQNNTLIIRAPGATAVRLWDPNRGEQGEWEYFDRYWPLSYLELRWQYHSGLSNRKLVYAQARYDDYPDGTDLGSQADDSFWPASSETIVLTVQAPNGNLAAPSAALESDTVSRGDWLRASIMQTLGKNEWYWAEFGRRVAGTDEINWDDHTDHYDFNEGNELAISTINYEPGEYMLYVYGGAPGYRNGETRLPVTITEGPAPGTSSMLLTDRTTSPVGVGIQIFTYTPQADHVTLDIRKEGDPEWRDERTWEVWEDRNWTNWEYWASDQPGNYIVTAKAWQNGDEILMDTVTLTFTVPETGGVLSKPDLSGFPAVLLPGDDFSGSVGVDSCTTRLNIDILFAPENDDWRDVYRSHREVTDVGVWTAVSIPETVFTQNGRYKLNVYTQAPGFAGEGTDFWFVKADQLSSDVVLTVNGSTNDISDLNSSTNVRVQVHAPGATAVRLLRDGWWDYQGYPETAEKFTWDMGFGDGDYNLIAQITTDEPVWRQEDFDWGEFRWEDLNWTDLSNAVKIHVSSPYGDLEAPQVTLDPADGVVSRGEWLTVEAVSQVDGDWIFCDLMSLNTDNPDNPWWNNIEHYDSSGSNRTRILIPTFNLSPGEYFLEVGIDKEGYNSASARVPVTILESDIPSEPSLTLSADTMLANEGITVYTYAPDSEYADLKITWDRDPRWWEKRSIGDGLESWDWGCGQGGVYTFVLTVHYPEESGKEDISISTMLTVISDGSLEKPVLTDVPTVIFSGQGIEGAFQNIEGATRYNIELEYCPDDGDWENLVREDRNPQEDGATALTFDAGLFERAGRYNLSVNATAPGMDNGYSEKRILVLPPTVSSDELELRIFDETDPERIGDVYLFQDLEISANHPDGVTAVRIWTGGDWFYFTDDEEWHRIYQGANEEGLSTYVAQATTDQSVAQWNEEHDGDFDGFDWGQVEWSMTSNMISVNVICRGDLEPPVLQVPQTVSRGDWLDITIEPVENAFAYGIRISRLPDDDDSDDEMVFDGSYTEAGTIRIPTDAFEPGIYEIYAESRRYGWRGHESQYMVYVEQPDDWTDEAVFKIEKTEVLTNEQFCASVYAPGALETRFCHEDLDNWWRDGEQSISGTFSCGRPDAFTFRAYALYDWDGEWEQIGSDLVVNVTAPYGSWEGSINGEAIAAVDEAYTFSVEIHTNGGNWDDGGIFMYSEDGTEMLSALGPQVQMERDITGSIDTVTFTIAAGALEEGTYLIDARFHPIEEGYEGLFMEKRVFVTQDASQRIITNIQSSYLSQEHPDITILAPGASHITMWVDKTSPVEECEETLIFDQDGEYIEDGVTFGASEGMRYVKITATYENGETYTDTKEITISAPYGDLPDPQIFMDGVWREGEPLSVYIELYSAAFIAAGVTDLTTDELVFSDEWPDETSVGFSVDADEFTPGHCYELWVHTSEIGYNYNEKIYNLWMLPADDVLTLPSGLNEIEEEAFAGVAAAGVVIPETVTAIGTRAFAGCPNLKVAVLPHDVSAISGDAFAGCGPLTVYGQAGSSAESFAESTEGMSFVCVR